jgi:hypothetical protein
VRRRQGTTKVPKGVVRRRETTAKVSKGVVRRREGTVEVPLVALNASRIGSNQERS